MKHSLLAGCIAMSLSFGASANNLSAEIDKLFANIDPASMPGCNVGVISDGKLIHKKGYGLSNMELDVRLDGRQVHRMGSVSKQFTAMAVLLLAEEGKIDLEADIRTYLPELKDYGHKVTVNGMLGHYAGMADYDFISGGGQGLVEQGLNIKSAAGGPFRIGNEDYLTISEFYDVVKQASLRHAPNEKLTYSNLAYFLLSMLVEEVSGESLRDYADKRIFKPLGMNETFFSDRPTEIVKNRASGYKPDDKEGYVTDMTNLFWVGDGGLHTSIEDMAKWDANFYSPKVGKDPDALLALFNTPNSQMDFRGGLYANGQMIAEKEGRTVFSHGGGWLGVMTMYERYPDDRFSTIVLCNNVAEKPWEHAEKISALHFKK